MGIALDDLAASIGGFAAVDVPLAPLTTYRVGGNAAVMARPRTLGDLARIAEVRRGLGPAALDVIVVGRGSNMLVADDGFGGIAVVVTDLDPGIGDREAGFDVTDGGGGTVEVVVPGGASLPLVARRLAAVGIVGFEWAVGIPGSVGGAVKMNAGGHGSDIAAVLVDVDVVDLGGATPGGPRTIPAAALGLRFRGSDVTDEQLVISARLRLERGDAASATARIAEIVRWRREHQPGGQNCGSVFVNPVPGEISAGLLIDGLGLRGLRVGTAGVSEKHANFIQASPDGSAADVLAVMRQVRDAVAEHTGYVLRSEVRLVGFDGLAAT